MSKPLTYILRVVPIIAFAGLSLTFYFSSPEQIIKVVGVENAYALMFVLAFLGGLTTFSGIPYHLVLITLAIGGLNPWFLAVTTASGVMIGDSTSYYIGYQGKYLLPQKMERSLERLSHLSQKHPRLMPFIFLAYGSMVPMSNDIITIPMGLLGYPFWQVMIPLGIGNFIFNTAVAFTADYTYQYIGFIS